jgi:hypothetical protein
MTKQKKKHRNTKTNVHHTGWVQAVSTLVSHITTPSGALFAVFLTLFVVVHDISVEDV